MKPYLREFVPAAFVEPNTTTPFSQSPDRIRIFYLFYSVIVNPSSSSSS